MSQVFSWYTDSSDPLLPEKKNQQRDSIGLKEQVPSVKLLSNLLPTSKHRRQCENFTALHETSAHDKGETRHAEN